VVSVVTGISPTQGRHRIDALAADGLLELDRRSVKGRVFCKLTAAGERILAEAGQ